MEPLDYKKDKTRQVPKTKEVCANKKYYDILYSYLQTISEEDKDPAKMKGNQYPRFVNKSDVNFSKIGQKLGLSRQTVSTKFKNLIELGLVGERDSNSYQLFLLPDNSATLIPYDTLQVLVDALNENAISVYAHLIHQWFAHQQEPFQITIDALKTQVGISKATRSNNDVITNILFVLQKIGLIKYSLVALSQEDDTFQNIKTIHQIDWITNKLEK